MIITEIASPRLCPECGGPSFSSLVLAEKKDACYHKVKASAKVWPSAYASGRLVQCRKKGAANYGKSKNESVAEGLNEFAPDGFNGGDDDEGFSSEIARMAQEDGFTKGASLADGATLERAIAINHWHNQHGGMYRQYFARGFRAGRLEKIRHNNKQYNLNLKLMKDGSIRHGEPGVAEGSETHKYKVVVKGQDRSYAVWVEAKNEEVAIIRAQQYVAQEHNDTAKRAAVVDMKQGVAEQQELEEKWNRQ